MDLVLGVSSARPIKGTSPSHSREAPPHGVSLRDLLLTTPQSLEQERLIRQDADGFMKELGSLGSAQDTASSASSRRPHSETSPPQPSSYTSNDTRDRSPPSIDLPNARYKHAAGTTLLHTRFPQHPPPSEPRGVPVLASRIGGRQEQAQQYWDDATDMRISDRDMVGWTSHTGQSDGLLSAVPETMQVDAGWPVDPAFSLPNEFLDAPIPNLPMEGVMQRALDAILDGMMESNGGRLPTTSLDAQLLHGLQNSLRVPYDTLQQMFQRTITQRSADLTFFEPPSLVSSLPNPAVTANNPDQQDIEDVIRFDLEEQRPICKTNTPHHDRPFSCPFCGSGSDNFTEHKRHCESRFHLKFHRCLVCNKIVGRHINSHMRKVHGEEPPASFRRIHYDPPDWTGYCIYCSPVKVFEGRRAAKWKELQKHMFNEHREHFQNPRRATQNQGSGFNRHDDSGGANGGSAGGGPRNSNAGGRYGHGEGGSGLGGTAWSGQQQGVQGPASGYYLDWSPGMAPSITDLLDRGRSIHRQGSFIRSERTSIGMPEADVLAKHLNRCETGCGTPMDIDYKSEDDDLSEMDVFGFGLEDEEITIDRVSTLPSISASIDDTKLIAHQNGRQKGSGPSGNGNLLPAPRKSPTMDLPIRGKCPVTTIARQHLSKEDMSLLERHYDFQVHVGGRVIMDHRPLGGCLELSSVSVASGYAWPALLLGGSGIHDGAN